MYKAVVVWKFDSTVFCFVRKASFVKCKEALSILTMALN